MGPSRWTVKVKLFTGLGSVTWGLAGVRLILIALGGSFGSLHRMLCLRGCHPPPPGVKRWAGKNLSQLESLRSKWRWSESSSGQAVGAAPRERELAHSPQDRLLFITSVPHTLRLENELLKVDSSLFPFLRLLGDSWLSGPLPLPLPQLHRPGPGHRGDTSSTQPQRALGESSGSFMTS